MTEHGVDVVVAESHLRFLASGHFDDELDIAVSVAHLGTTSMIMRHRITRAADAVLLADIEMRYVWIDVASQARGKTPVPGWARDALSAYQVSAPAESAAGS